MNAPTQRHVFVSYSRANSDFANKLMRDLQAQGIGVWIDHTGIQPGTPNWERAIREAIDTAFAIVLVASPESAQSKLSSCSRFIRTVYKDSFRALALNRRAVCLAGSLTFELLRRPRPTSRRHVPASLWERAARSARARR